MQSSNPVLTRRGTFSHAASAGYATFRDPSADELQQAYEAPSYTPSRMTIDDVVIRTAAMLGVILVTGAAAWVLNLGSGVALIAALAGFALAMVVVFKKKTSPGLILTYSALEGIFLGAISHAFEARYPGIVIQAVLGTAMAFGGMLLAYKSGAIRVTPKFTKIVVGAGIGLVGLMVVNLLAGFFTDGGLGLRDGGALAIVFSLAAIVVASLFLALDFDQIEKAIAAGAPEKEAWLAAFGLVVTLVWLYLEILRLISYFRD